MVLYGVFPYFVDTLLTEMMTGLSVACHLRVADAKVVACLQFLRGLHVRRVLIEVVEHSESRVDKMLQALERFLACLTETPKLRGLDVDEVGKFSDMMAKSVFDGVAVVLPRLDIQMIGDVLRMVSIRYFHGVESCIIEDWLVVRLRSTRRISIIKRFPVLSRVSLM